MEIIISNQDKKILVDFCQSKLVDKFVIDKSDSFLSVLDRFFKKRKMKIAVFQKADLKFVNVSILTERIIRAIIAGLRF